MSFPTCLADFEMRDYLAFREVIGFCHRHNCYYYEDASRLCIVSNFSGHLWACVSSLLVADSRVDTPHVALLRALVDCLERDGEHDSIVHDRTVLELLLCSAA